MYKKVVTSYCEVTLDSKVVHLTTKLKIRRMKTRVLQGLQNETWTYTTESTLTLQAFHEHAIKHNTKYNKIVTCL